MAHQGGSVSAGAATGAEPVQSCRVGFLGVGLMGHGMARNILARGFKLSVMAHRNREPIDDLVTRGAAELGFPLEVAEVSDVVVLCLPNSDVVERILTGSDGLLAAQRASFSPLLIVDCSTGDPTRTASFAAMAAQAGAEYFDAPVNRTSIEALAGSLHVLVGAEDAQLQRARPVLESFSEVIHHVGGVGTGHQAKVIHNFISQGNATILAEAFTTAAKVGVDLAALAEVCRHSGGHSTTFDRIIPFVLSGDDGGLKFAIRNAEKDMNYYTALTRAAGSTSLVAESVRLQFQLATQLGYGDKFAAHIFDALGELNGTVVHQHRTT